MKYTLNDLYTWCDAVSVEHFALLKTLAAIPAPSHQEDRRVKFIHSWLKENGAETVIVDEAKNVILPLPADEKGPFRVFMAHTDVVFPDTDPLPVREETGCFFAPGVGDDTANVVALMLCAKYLLTNHMNPVQPILIVFNSCEEGLGNLKGIRQLMHDYSGRILDVTSFDCQSNSIVSRAVGSERWKVTAFTNGGHSYSDFGTASAIDHLSRLVGRLYQQSVPQKQGTKTTYNVGLISGGTSVNTIAQKAEMTYEYRSDDRECLAFMAQQFRQLLEEAACTGVRFEAESIGIRPCGGDVDEEKLAALLSRCRSAISRIYNIEAPCCSASTDANIPLSLGIPAATFGLYRGGGAHTREEFVWLDSLTPGLKIALPLILEACFPE